jgi:hypothetical protein
MRRPLPEMCVGQGLCRLDLGIADAVPVRLIAEGRFLPLLRGGPNLTEQRSACRKKIVNLSEVSYEGHNVI